MAWEAVPLRMKYRVVNRVTMAEVIHDLAHINSSWRNNSMQPGLSGASAVGSFTITLPPILSDEYERNAIDYGKLDYFLRVEGYVEAIAGQPKVAGFITGINRTATATTLTGYSDIWLAARQRPFPGETVGHTTALGMLLVWLGDTEVGFSDDFSGASPLTPYTSTNIPGLTSGTWTATTDDGLSAVTCSTGTGAVLLSTTASNLGANDDYKIGLVELTGRIKLNSSTDATNAGEIGVVFGADASNCTLVKARFRDNGANSWTPYTVDITCQRFAAGVSVAGPTTVTAALNNQMPSGLTHVDVQIQVFLSDFGAGNDDGIWVAINGQSVTGPSTVQPNAFANMKPADMTNVKIGPYFGIPASGTTDVYVTSLYTLVRYTNGVSNRASTFTGTTLSGGSQVPRAYSAAGPNFLEQYQRATEAEGYQWRYTPQALKSGIRTLGDFIWGPSLGTDLSSSVRFIGGVNLLDVIETPPAAGLGTSLQLNGGSIVDSGSQIIARNKSAMSTYGVIDDNQLNLTAQEFRSLRKNALSLAGHQSSPSSPITLVVARDPQTADRWRELDTIYAHWPERGIINQTYKVYSYTLNEGSPVQEIQVGQYGAQQIADRARRNFYALQQIGNTFKTR